MRLKMKFLNAALLRSFAVLSTVFFIGGCTRPEAAKTSADKTVSPSSSESAESSESSASGTPSEKADKGTSSAASASAETQAADPLPNRNQEQAQAQNHAQANTSQNAPEATMTITLANGAAVTWIQDNEGQKLNARSLFSDASDELYNSLNMLEGIPASISVFLLQAEGEYILFDAGLGSFGGHMKSRLEKLGIQPEAIRLIYLTHFHADHIGGLIAKGADGADVKAFPNAEIYAGKAEYDAWMNHIEKNELQKKILGIYQDKLHLFNFGEKLPHGVLALDAAGHTPGHTAFQYQELLVIGDLMHGYALQKDHPEINSNYDMDKEKSIESRKRILDYARQNNLTMAGMHLPPPGFVKH